MKNLSEIFLTGIVLSVLCLGLIMALAWPVETSTYPLVTAGGGFCLAVIAVVQDIRHLTGEKNKKIDRRATDAKRVYSTFAWILAFFIGVFIFGFEWGLSMVTFMFYKIEAGLSWVVSFLLGFLTWGFLYFVSNSLHLSLYKGLVFSF